MRGNTTNEEKLFRRKPTNEEKTQMKKTLRMLRMKLSTCFFQIYFRLVITYGKLIGYEKARDLLYT